MAVAAARALCRDPSPQGVRVIRGVSHRLLRLPAILHRQDQLGLHLLLQQTALQRSPQETPHQLMGRANHAGRAPVAANGHRRPSDIADIKQVTHTHEFYISMSNYVLAD